MLVFQSVGSNGFLHAFLYTSTFRLCVKIFNSLLITIIKLYQATSTYIYAHPYNRHYMVLANSVFTITAYIHNIDSLLYWIVKVGSGCNVFQTLSVGNWLTSRKPLRHVWTYNSLSHLHFSMAKCIRNQP